MNEAMLKAILKRIKALEETRPKMKRGVVVSTVPLVINLSGTTVPLEVNYLASYTPTIGDQVQVAAWGGDLIVLGAVA